MKYLKKTGIRFSVFQRILMWAYRKYVFVPTIEALEMDDPIGDVTSTPSKKSHKNTPSAVRMAYEEKKMLEWFPSDEGIYRTDH